MKKSLFLTAVLCLILQATGFAQSIKLNNQDDPGSAMLEVSSPSKGILIPNVALTGTTDATTIASPAASLLVYNTATVSNIIPGYYYNSGTAISPVWSRLSTGISSQIGANTTNYLSKWNGSALVSSSIFDNGTNVGIGTSSPSFPIDIQGTGGERLRVYSKDTYFAGYLSKNSTREFFAGVQWNIETNDAISGYHIYDNTAGVQRFVIDKDGDVGIGQANPNAKLHVNGNVKVAGIISGVSDPVDAQDAATKAYVDLISSPCVLSIGDTHKGGIIFYLDGSGCHGLVAKATDEPGTYIWAPSSIDTWAFAAGIYGGAQNTKKLIYRMGVGNAPAAGQCEGLTDGGFTDWYLPSKDELDMMFVNLHLQLLGGFSSSLYWSSTEYDYASAWRQYFGTGFQDKYNKSTSHNVRAVRAF